jgi:energy-coupling factor transport system ATP-binding protein
MDVMGSAGAAIRVTGLDVRYPGAHALRGVDLSIARGSFALIGGRSGSGKSTLAQALLGLLREDERLAAPEVSGRIGVAGRTPREQSVAEMARHAGLIFQNPVTQLFNGTVEEEVGFGPRNLGLGEGEVARRVSYGLEAVGGEHLRGRSVRRLSGGEQQRVAIAANLAMRPSILILDEPTANLDGDGTALVVQALGRLQRDLGITVVVIEHRLAPFLEYADRLIWLEGGRVAADGAPEEVLPRVKAAPWEGAPRFNGGAPLVSLEAVTVGYDGRPVLRDCSLTLRQGDLAALVGANGSGKSTLARALAGLLRPWQGRVVWQERGAAGGRVGLLQQNPLHQLVCGTVEEEVRFAPRNLGRRGDGEENGWLEDLLAAMGLRDLRQRSTQALSVGEQQRAALAATLSARPRLLILDEPTLGQDRHHLRELMGWVQRLNEGGQTVLLITHDRELVAHCAGRVWELVQGRVRRCEKGERLER